MLKKKYNSSFYLIILIFVYYFILHFYPTDIHFLNYDWVFLLPIDYIKTGNSFFMEEVYFRQANTYGYSLFGYFLIDILGLPKNSIIMRIPSVFGNLLIFYSGYKILKFEKIEDKTFIWAFLLLLNPILWIYSGRVSTDILGSSLAFFAFSIFYINKKYEKFLLSSILFSISIIIKYHAFIFSICFAYLIFLREKNISKFIIKNINFFILPVLTLLVFTLINYQKFDVILFSQKFQNLFSDDKDNYIIALFNFLYFSSIFFAPCLFLYYFEFLKEKKFQILFCLTGISVLAIYIINPNFVSSHGEMNFGTHFLVKGGQGELNFGTDLGFVELGEINIFYFFLPWFIYFIIKNSGKDFLKAESIKYVIIVLLIFFYILFPNLRTTQRYLIFILPVLILFFVINYDINKLKDKFTKFAWLIVILFQLSINFYFSSYQILVSQMISNTINYVDNKKIRLDYCADVSPFIGYYYKKDCMKRNTEPNYYLDAKDIYALDLVILDEFTVEKKFSANFFGKDLKSIYVLKRYEQ